MPVAERIKTMIAFAQELSKCTKSKRADNTAPLEQRLNELVELGTLLTSQHETIEANMMKGVVTKEMMEEHLRQTAAWFEQADKLNTDMTKSVTQALGVKQQQRVVVELKETDEI